MSTTLVKNGTIVTATDQYAADIFIDNGVITLIGQGLNIPAAEVVDASGLLVMPGGVDVHTHLDLPVAGTTSSDDFETGTIAAACGGTTTVVDFATGEPGARLRRGLDDWHSRAIGRAVVDYGFHMVVRTFDDETAREMDHLARHDGVTSFKLYMAYPGTMMADDVTIFKAMRRSRDNGSLVCLHAEHGGVIDVLVHDALARGDTAPRFHALTRPPRAEGEAVGRAVALAALAGSAVYIVHVTCRDALDEIARGRQQGLAVFGETCPQYLFLDAGEYARDGFDAAMFVMSPPLREAWHQDHLWHALADGGLQVVASDHCPFNLHDPAHKRAGESDFSKIPNGVPGIETRLMLLWGGVREGRISAQRFVDLAATGPARMFGLWPRKGTIAVGSDGDLVLWNPQAEVTLMASTLHMRVDYSPYEGRTITGGPAVVLSRGDVIVDHGVVKARAGRGQYVPRLASGQEVV